MQTLQIATFGDGQEGIVAGIRNFPVHKLILLCYEEEKAQIEEFARRIRNTLGLPVSEMFVSDGNVIRDVLQSIAKVISEEGSNFDQILMNVSAGDKMMGCAALSAAFVNGIKAFGMDQEGCPMLLPVLKLSYNEIVSDAKLRILRAIDGAGGEVESLEKLSEVSKYGKPLLSYHVQGSRESKGLADLGLVEVNRVERGKITVKLSTLGKLLIASDVMALKA
ncbi:MAG: DUF6293 family protein [Nitrososphaerales archaeon]